MTYSPETIETIKALEANGYEEAEEMRPGVFRLLGLGSFLDINKIAFVRDEVIGTNTGRYERRQEVEVVSPDGATVIWSGSFAEVLSTLVTK